MAPVCSDGGLNWIFKVQKWLSVDMDILESVSSIVSLFIDWSCIFGVIVYMITGFVDDL